MSSFSEVFPHIFFELLDFPLDPLTHTRDPFSCLCSILRYISQSEASQNLHNSDHGIEAQNKQKARHHELRNNSAGSLERTMGTAEHTCNFSEVLVRVPEEARHSLINNNISP